MARLAIIQSGLVVNIIVGKQADFPETINITDQPEVAIGWTYDGQTFIAPPVPDAPPPVPILTITLDKDIAAVEELVIATAEVTVGGHVYTGLTDTYFVPVVGFDGRHKVLLEVPLVDGLADGVEIRIDERGMYKLDMSMIRPKPTAKISNTPELIIR